jgi:hypothetical protein
MQIKNPSNAPDEVPPMTVGKQKVYVDPRVVERNVLEVVRDEKNGRIVIAFDRKPVCRLELDQAMEFGRHVIKSVAALRKSQRKK